MKIIHSKITASTSVVKIPTPLDKYYKIISDQELADMTGYDDTSSIAEEVPGYEVEHLAWVVPKEEYEDILSDNGLWEAELLKEGNHVFIGYVVRDRIYSITIDDIRRAGVED